MQCRRALCGQEAVEPVQVLGELLDLDRLVLCHQVARGLIVLDLGDLFPGQVLAVREDHLACLQHDGALCAAQVEGYLDRFRPPLAGVS